MNYKYLIIFVIPFLFACGEQGSEAPATDEEAVVLVEVDSTPVTLAMLERMMEVRGVSEDDHEGMRELLDELIRTQAVVNAARAEGLAEDPGVQVELRLAEMQTLYRNYLEGAQQGGSITEQDIRDVYEAQLERSGDTQYRIEVIGYEDQARARAAISRVQGGEVAYTALRAEARASELTVDEPGWIDRSQVPEEFADLLAETEPGGVVEQPLKNARGWFLVRVTDTRDLQVPSFDQVRDGIARTLRQQRRKALVDSLYDQAEITPMLPLEEAEAEGED
jgi:peptidyl-prolyl cis-trans isomerase C